MGLYILKIDILENSGLTSTHYSVHKYGLKEARYAAQETRNKLWKNRAYGELKDYTVDVVPCND